MIAKVKYNHINDEALLLLSHNGENWYSFQLNDGEIDSMKIIAVLNKLIEHIHNIKNDFIVDSDELDSE